MPRVPAKSHDAPLNEGELEIAKMYVEGHSTRQIGAALKQDYGNVARILRRKHVKTYVEEAQRDAMDALRRQMSSAAGEAFGVLREIAGDSGSPAAARVQAARTILDRVLPARTVVEGGETPLTLVVSTDVARMTDAELDALAGDVDG